MRIEERHLQIALCQLAQARCEAELLEELEIQGCLTDDHGPTAVTFTHDNHDALGPDDYVMVHYEGDKIVPTK